MKSLTTICLTAVACVLGFLVAVTVRQAAQTHRASGGDDPDADREPAFRPATRFQRETLAAEGVDATAMSEAEALRRLRHLFPDWDDHES